MKFLKSILALVVALAFAGVAMAADTPQESTTLTLTDSSIAGSATETSTSEAVWIKANNGFAVWPTISLVGGGSGNVTFSFQLSRDGSTWTTTTPLTYALASDGTNTVRGYALYDHLDVDHARYVRLASIANAATGVCTVSSVVITRNRD